MGLLLISINARSTAMVAPVLSCLSTHRRVSQRAWFGHWQRSPASKQIIGLLKAMLQQAAPAFADQRHYRARSDSAAVKFRDVLLGAMDRAIRVAWFLLLHAEDRQCKITLWPELRRWLLEGGGFAVMYGAAAAAMRMDPASPSAYYMLYYTHCISAQAATQLTNGARELPPALLPPVVSATLTLFDAVREEFSATSAALSTSTAWPHLPVAMISAISIMDGLNAMPRDAKLREQLHLGQLRVWPGLMLLNPSPPGPAHWCGGGDCIVAACKVLEELLRQPEPVMRAYWARHWACALDTLCALGVRLSIQQAAPSEAGSNTTCATMVLVASVFRDFTAYVTDTDLSVSGHVRKLWALAARWVGYCGIDK